MKAAITPRPLGRRAIGWHAGTLQSPIQGVNIWCSCFEMKRVRPALRVLGRQQLQPSLTHPDQRKLPCLSRPAGMAVLPRPNS